MGNAPTWDLDTLCRGGVAGAAFGERRETVETQVAQLSAEAERLGSLDRDAAGWARWVAAMQQAVDDLDELTSLAVCAASADSRSADARTAEAAADDLQSQLDEALVQLQARLGEADEAGFQAFVARPDVADAAAWLHHQRQGNALRLDASRQALWVALEREATFGWGRLYDRVSGDISGDLTVGGRTRTVGAAELAALRSSPDAAVRAAAHVAHDQAWGSVADLCATSLTHITGARQTYQDRAGIDELATTLHDNRCSRATLDALRQASEALRPTLVKYLDRKATVLGMDRLAWWDLEAPLPGPDAPTDVPFDRMGEMVVEAFGGFHGELADFARRALDEGWIEAEARDGKRPGGFCTDFPVAQVSRIFMTYTGSLENGTTLAHELGHAWHNEVVYGQPSSRRRFTSGLAETASTFAEAVFRDRLLEAADDRATRAFMLDADLSAGVAFLMNIPMRFDFERRLFALRRQGPLQPDQLSTEIEALQRHHYAGALSHYSPLFWASKLHFYIPEFGFYNWPYTFGYLFSAAVYQRAKQEGPSFLPTLTELLLRTGWQDAEGLAADVLGADLTDPAFWITAAKPLEARVDAFLEATDS